MSIHTELLDLLDRIAGCNAELHGWQLDAADLAKRLRETALAASGYDELLRHVSHASHSPAASSSCRLSDLPVYRSGK